MDGLKQPRQPALTKNNPSPPQSDEIPNFFRSFFSLKDNFALTNDTILQEIPGWDSLEGIQILHQLEEQFQVEIELEDLANLKTIGCIKRAIKKQLSK